MFKNVLVALIVVAVLVFIFGTFASIAPVLAKEPPVHNHGTINEDWDKKNTGKEQPNGSSKSGGQEPKITICHAHPPHVWGSWNKITVSASSIVKSNGHDGHSADIIPPFDWSGGHYSGKNWDEEGQAVYNNDCKLVLPSPTPTEPVPTEPVPTEPVPTPAKPMPTMEVCLPYCYQTVVVEGDNFAPIILICGDSNTIIIGSDESAAKDGEETKALVASTNSTNNLATWASGTNQVGLPNLLAAGLMFGGGLVLGAGLAALFLLLVMFILAWIISQFLRTGSAASQIAVPNFRSPGEIRRNWSH